MTLYVALHQRKGIQSVKTRNEFWSLNVWGPPWTTLLTAHPPTEVCRSVTFGPVTVAGLQAPQYRNLQSLTMQCICTCPASCVIADVLQASLQSLKISKLSFPVRKEIFLFFKSSRPALGPTQPPIQRVPGALARESGRVKWQGFEIAHSFNAVQKSDPA
jgi:hypothetical protein